MDLHSEMFLNAGGEYVNNRIWGHQQESQCQTQGEVWFLSWPQYNHGARVNIDNTALF